VSHVDSQRSFSFFPYTFVLLFPLIAFLFLCPFIPVCPGGILPSPHVDVAPFLAWGLPLSSCFPVGVVDAASFSRPRLIPPSPSSSCDSIFFLQSISLSFQPRPASSPVRDHCLLFFEHLIFFPFFNPPVLLFFPIYSPPRYFLGLNFPILSWVRWTFSFLPPGAGPSSRFLFSHLVAFL